ncbi:MAG: type II secretion system F family protein [Verrucomicrobiae bacterium]|nr:type II secretion system F family protein [Verrucomicrobiae bacterium]
MPVFSYTAIDEKGKTVTGQVTVASRREVYEHLANGKLNPIEVKSASGSGADRRKEAAGRRTSEKPKLTRAQLIYFTEELADLLDAGLQLQQALAIMQDRQDSEQVREVSRLLREELREGARVSVALESVSPSFDDLYCNLVAAGEASGSLTSILRRLAENMTILHELRARVTQAMIYPAFMIAACIGLMVVFSLVLMPRLTGMLAKTGQKLPFVTEMLVKFSHAMAAYWWVALVTTIVVFIAFRCTVARPAGRVWWDRVKLSIPLIGPVMLTRFLASFCQALGNLVINGVPLLSGLRLMTRATTNQFYRELLEQVVYDVSGGMGLSAALRKTEHFPTLLSDMIAVGEQTGKLGMALQKSAARYDKELDRRISRLTSLISPIIIVFMAGIVTVVAYSIVTGIFTSIKGIRNPGGH